jgi:hypothetical protein
LTALIELHFLPSIEYFCALAPYDTIIIERHENFTRQTYRSRCHILTAQGMSKLTVPVTTSGKVKITDVAIDRSVRWQERMWRSIESAYAKAPYFEHYADELRGELFYKGSYLYEMNFLLLSLCLKWLRWPKTVLETRVYEKNLPPAHTDLRGVISAKTDYRHRGFYHPLPYQQVFGKEFTPNLSLLDLVFCEGPYGTTLVKGSSKGELNK